MAGVSFYPCIAAVRRILSVDAEKLVVRIAGSGSSMLGPVFWLELLRVARRGGHHRLRWGVVLALVGEAAVFLLLCWSILHPLFRPMQGAAADAWLRAAWLRIAGLVSWGLEWLVLQQLAVVVLVAPALAAGSISDEKATGTLDHLLATPLESRHIIVGKWLAQMMQMAILILPGIPMVVLAGAIVGLGTAEVVALALLPLVPLPALVAASLLASVWSRRTASAIIRLYVVLAAGGLAVWLGGAGEWLGPGGVIAACLAGDGTGWKALIGPRGGARRARRGAASPPGGAAAAALEGALFR
jgi:hypothetical protein